MQSIVIDQSRPYDATVSRKGTTNYPLLGIVSTILGTLLAVNYIPVELDSEWALVTSASIMSVGLAIAPLVAAFRDPKSILRGEHLLALGPIYWILLDLLQGSYAMDTIPREYVSTAFIAIGVFVVAMWVAASYLTSTVPRFVIKSVNVEFSGDTYFLLSIVAFIIGMLKFAIPCNFNIVEMFSYLGDMRWAAPWARGQLGGWDAFLDHLAYFGYLMPVLTVIIARYKGWINVRTLFCGMMTLFMTLFLMQGGGRRIIGVIFGMAMILWVLTEKRLRIRHVFITAVSIAALLIVMQLIVEYRDIGFTELITDSGQKKEVFKRDKLHVDDNFYRMCQIMQFIPDSYPYVYHQYIVFILVRPIPRVFWPGKPVDPGFDLPTALGITGVSYSSSVLGELYISGGLIAIALGGFLYGWLASLASKLLMIGNTFGVIVLYSVLMMALFAGIRSMLDLVLVNYVFLAWIGFSRLLIYLKKGRQPLNKQIVQT